MIDGLAHSSAEPRSRSDYRGTRDSLVRSGVGLKAAAPDALLLEELEPDDVLVEFEPDVDDPYNGSRLTVELFAH